MPDQAAAVVCNYLSPGLNPHLWYRTLRGTSHILNGVQLGLSAFHMGFTTLDAAVSRLAIGLEDVVAGRGGMALHTLASVPVSPVTNFMAGARLRSAVLENPTTGEMGQLVKHWKRAAGALGRTRRMVRLSSGHTVRLCHVGGKRPLRRRGANEASHHGICGARQKLGVFADMAKRELLNPGMDPVQLQQLPRLVVLRKKHFLRCRP